MYNIKIIYLALVQSILTYGIIVWGSAYKNILEPLNVVRLVRIMFEQYYNHSYGTDDLFKMLKVLTIEQL